MRSRALAPALLALLVAAPLTAAQVLPTPTPPAIPPGVAAASPACPAAATGQETPGCAIHRDLQPVVVPGAQLPSLAVVANYVELPPEPAQCGTPVPQCPAPLAPPASEEAQDGVFLPLEAVPGQAAGTPVGEIAAYRYEDGAFVPIRVQVDERFPRYLTNYESEFGAYSQADLEMTYAFDVDGRKKESHAGDPGFDGAARACADPADPSGMTAALCDPDDPAERDPVPGLDSDDEVAFMFRDAGSARAPPSQAPAGASALTELTLVDPLEPGAVRYAYLARHAAPAAFAPLVAYQRDADADGFVASNRGNYGGSQGGGPCWSHDGEDTNLVDAPAAKVDDCAHRRPRDSATVTAESYRFHYAGRWKMDELRLADGQGGFGPDLIDRWKGRAFQLRSDVGALSSIAYEDETYWSKSSITLGERAGAVRVLRETWGADSGTHVTRLETFYAHHFEQVYHLRVHPIPVDGIYAFWDHNVGAVDTYFSPLAPGGVPIDGQNDEALMCREAPPGSPGTAPLDPYANPHCPGDNAGFMLDIPDPAVQAALSNLAWDQVAGGSGSMVTTIEAVKTAPAGVLTTYYRDDLRFDDGTGHDPTPALQKGEPGCAPEAADPPMNCQGAFGSHGVHFFFTGDTDNLLLPAPATEFVARTAQYLLPGLRENVGARIQALDGIPVVAAAPAAPAAPAGPNWARDGSFEGPEGVGYQTYERSEPTTAASAEGATAIRHLDTDAGGAIPPGYATRGNVVGFMRSGLQFGDLASVSYQVLLPAKTSAWPVQANHYIAFDTDEDGLSDGCVSSSSQTVAPGPGWQTLRWDADATYQTHKWRNCHWDGEPGFPEWDAVKSGTLRELQASHPHLRVRSVAIQVFGAGAQGIGPDPAYVDDLKVLGSGASAPLRIGLGDGFVARITPQRATGHPAPAPLAVAMDYDSRGFYTFEVSAVNATGSPKPFRHWRMDFVAPAAGLLVPPQADAMGWAVSGASLHSAGSYGAVSQPLPANDGDAQLTVKVPAAKLRNAFQATQPNVVLVRFSIIDGTPAAGTERVSSFSALANVAGAVAPAAANLIDLAATPVILRAPAPPATPPPPPTLAPPTP